MFGEYPAIVGAKREDIPRALKLLGFAYMTEELMALYDQRQPLTRNVVHFLATAAGEWTIIIHKGHDLELLKRQMKIVAPDVNVMSDSELADAKFRRYQ